MTEEQLKDKIEKGCVSLDDFYRYADEHTLKVTEVFNHFAVMYARCFLENRDNFDEFSYFLDNIWDCIQDFHELEYDTSELSRFPLTAARIFEAFESGGFDYGCGDPIEANTIPALTSILDKVGKNV